MTYHLLLSPNGRLPRRPFLIALAGVAVAGLVTSMLPVIGDIVAMALLWPLLCATAQRLHDAGRGAAPAIVVTLLCAIVASFGIIVGLVVPNMANAMLVLALGGVIAALGAIAFVAALALLAWAALLRSDPQANRFGRPMHADALFGTSM